MGYFRPLTGTAGHGRVPATPGRATCTRTRPQVTDAPGLFHNKECWTRPGVEAPKTWGRRRQKLRQGVDTLGHRIIPCRTSTGGNTVDRPEQKILTNGSRAGGGLQKALTRQRCCGRDPNDAYNQQMALFKEGR